MRPINIHTSEGFSSLLLNISWAGLDLLDLDTVAWDRNDLSSNILLGITSHCIYSNIRKSFSRVHLEKV